MYLKLPYEFYMFRPIRAYENIISQNTKRKKGWDHINLCKFHQHDGLGIEVDFTASEGKLSVGLS